MKIVLYKKGRLFIAPCAVITPATVQSFIKDGWTIKEYMH